MLGHKAVLSKLKKLKSCKEYSPTKMEGNYKSTSEGRLEIYMCV